MPEHTPFGEQLTAALAGKRIYAHDESDESVGANLNADDLVSRGASVLAVRKNLSYMRILAFFIVLLLLYPAEQRCLWLLFCTCVNAILLNMPCWTIAEPFGK